MRVPYITYPTLPLLHQSQHPMRIYLAKAKYSVYNPIRRRGKVVTARKKSMSQQDFYPQQESSMQMIDSTHTAAAAAEPNTRRRFPVRNPHAVHYSQMQAAPKTCIFHAYHTARESLDNGYREDTIYPNHQQHPFPRQEEEDDYQFYQVQESNERFLQQPRPPFQGRLPPYRRRMEYWEEPILYDDPAGTIEPQQQEFIDPHPFASSDDFLNVPTPPPMHGPAAQVVGPPMFVQHSNFHHEMGQQPTYSEFDDTTTCASPSASTRNMHYYHAAPFQKNSNTSTAEAATVNATPWRSNIHSPKDDQSLFDLPQSFDDVSAIGQPNIGLERFQRYESATLSGATTTSTATLRLFNNGIEVNYDGESLFGPSSE